MKKLGAMKKELPVVIYKILQLMDDQITHLYEQEIVDDENKTRPFVEVAGMYVSLWDIRCSNALSEQEHKEFFPLISGLVLDYCKEHLGWNVEGIDGFRDLLIERCMEYAYIMAKNYKAEPSVKYMALAKAFLNHLDPDKAADPRNWMKAHVVIVNTTKTIEIYMQS